jgi:hypothetical protein
MMMFGCKNATHHSTIVVKKGGRPFCNPEISSNQTLYDYAFDLWRPTDHERD